MNIISPKNSIQKRISRAFVVLVVVLLLVYAIASTIYIAASLRQQLIDNLKIQSTTALLAVEDRFGIVHRNLGRLINSDVMINSIIDLAGRRNDLSRIVADFNAANGMHTTTIVDYAGRTIHSSGKLPDIPHSLLVLTLEIGRGQLLYSADTKRVIFIEPLIYYDTPQAAAIVEMEFPQLASLKNDIASEQRITLFSGEHQIIGTQPDQLAQFYQVITSADSVLPLAHELNLELHLYADRRHYDKPIGAAIMSLLVIGSVILSITYWVARTVGHSLSGPILTLRERVARQAAGEEIRCAPLGTNDELDVLAEMFDQHTQNISRTAQQLQEEVQRRKATQADLEKHRDTLEEVVETRTHQLQIKATELEQANRHKSNFLANMSHELRTPLNSTIGFSKRVLKSKASTLAPRDVDALQTVIKNGKYLLALVNDILDLSKVESGETTINNTYFSANDLLNELSARFDPIARQKRLSLVYQKNGPLESVHSDPHILTQILNNLISNAIKYTDRGTIVVSLHNTQCELIMTVQDQGIGISTQDQANLFNDYMRVNTDKIAGIQGTGLGLAITARLVNLLNGRIDVFSEEGHGARFVVSIPLS